MSLSDQFQEAIKSGRFKQALLIAFSNNLQFKTITSIVSASTSRSYSLESSLSLIEGVKTKISREFLTQSPEKLKEFHQQQLEQANQTWDKNRETLLKVFHLLAQLSAEVSSTPQERPENLDLDLGGLPEEQLEKEESNLDLELTPINPENTQAETELPDSLGLSQPSELTTEETELETEKAIQLEVKERPEEDNWVDTVTEEAIPGDLLTEGENDDPALEIIPEGGNGNSEQPLEKEAWDNLLDEMETEQTSSDSEKTPMPTEETEGTEEIDDDDDWEEWLDDDKTSSPDSSEDLDELDWEDEQNLVKSNRTPSTTV